MDRLKVNKRQQSRNFQKKLLQVICVATVFSILLGLIIHFVGNRNSTSIVPSFTWPIATRRPAITSTDVSATAAPMFNNAYWLSVRGDCGTTKVTPDLVKVRIVGGVEAKKNSWPWQIALVKYEDYGDGFTSISHQCGGTLVGPKFVITAVHCFLNAYGTQVITNTHNFRVIVGGHEKAKLSSGASLSRISKVYHHPANNLAVFSRLNQAPMYDVTLVKLARTYSPHNAAPVMNFACLPNPGELPSPGELCWTSGWGSTKGTGFDKVLKQTSLPIVTKDRCDSFWPKQISYDVHLCAEDLSSGTCQGDSGGPLVCQGPDGRWTLYGATSFGHNTCFSSPSVFASVSFTVEWLCCHLDDYGPCSAVGCSLS